MNGSVEIERNGWTNIECNNLPPETFHKARDVGCTLAVAPSESCQRVLDAASSPGCSWNTTESPRAESPQHRTASSPSSIQGVYGSEQEEDDLIIDDPPIDYDFYEEPEADEEIDAACIPEAEVTILDNDNDDRRGTELQHREQQQQQQKLCDDEAVVDLAARAEGAPSSVGGRAQELALCKVCHADLSSHHYLQRIQHVKSCLNRRQLSGSKRKAIEGPPLHKQAPLLRQLKLSAVSHVDMRSWMQGLGMAEHVDTFLKEEVDMTIVHALSDEDLRTLGVTDRLTQRRFIDAARQFYAEVQANDTNDRIGGGVEDVGASLAAPQPKKEKKQQTLHFLGLRPLRKADDPSKPSAQAAPAIETIPTAASLRSTERFILSCLYPSRCESKVGPSKQQPTDGRPKPMLRPAAVLHSSRVPRASSLWQCAAACQPVTATLEARLEARKATLPSTAAREPLARGGVHYGRAEETRALKLVKLQALREELAQHEATVAELRQLVKELEQDDEMQPDAV